MSYKQCLSNGLNEGSVTKNQYDEQMELLKDLELHFKNQGYDASEAAKRAGKMAFDAFEIKSARKKKVARLKLKAIQDIKKKFTTYRNAKGEEDLNEAAINIYTQSDTAKFPSLESAIYEEQAIVLRYLDELLAALKEGSLEKVTGLFGRKSKKRKTTESILIKAMLGEDVQDPIAKAMAASWKKANDLAVSRFNKYGGDIKIRFKNYLPQIHDFIAIGKAGEKAWTKFIFPLLDRKQMIDGKTGLPFVNDEELYLALSQVYKNIVNGKASRAITGQAKSNFANKRLDHRFLVFKDGDSWLKYNESFGNKNGGILPILMKHLDSLARDTAIMKTLGPDPDQAFLEIKNLVLTKGRAAVPEKGEKALFAAEKAIRGGMFSPGVENLHLYFKNQLGQPGDPFWARGLSNLRQFLTSSYLGSASIVALTDFRWQQITNGYNGLPLFKSARRTLELYKEGLLKKDKQIAKLAIRTQLLAESWTPYSLQVNRFMAEVNGSEFSQRLADATLSLSGLQGHTQAGRWAFGMEFQGFIADNVGKKFSELDPKFQKTLKRYGIEEDSWDIARKTKLYDAGEDVKGYEGVEFFVPDDIRMRTDLTDEQREILSSKFYDMIRSETEFAVPSLSAKGRVTLLQNAKPGTIMGELALSAAMFKQFPITLMFTHVARGMNEKGLGKLGYMANLAISSAIFGGMTMELREITKGRNPTPLQYIKENPGEYFLRGLVNGGGLGIFGDFFLSDTNRYGKSLADTIPGPAVGFISDFVSIPKNAIFDYINGRETNVVGDALNFIKRNTPGSSVWYLRLIWERVIMETIQKGLDNDFYSRANRLISKYARDTQQDYWWSPGESVPSGLPEVPFSK